VEESFLELSMRALEEEKERRKVQTPPLPLQAAPRASEPSGVTAKEEVTGETPQGYQALTGEAAQAAAGAAVGVTLPLPAGGQAGPAVGEREEGEGRGGRGRGRG